jgi:site-specific DNA-methyltransferase (adenine-specific)
MADKTNECPMHQKRIASRNRTIRLSDEDHKLYRQRLRYITAPAGLPEIMDSTICQDLFDVMRFLPDGSFALIFADPPYNLTKNFNGSSFRQTELDQYERWLETWLPEMKRLLKPGGSIYVCGDWRSSAAIHRVLLEHFTVRNRISWEREKGRGARTNWKNNTEDIWYATVSDEYTFNVEDVKLRRRVIAPYTDDEGNSKDWRETDSGRYRMTYPSNIWTDMTVPFWSMPENTQHPTQKPEKLLAKVILASTNPGDIVFDPFMGSGTTSVAAKKLGRHYVGVEVDTEYCMLAEKRLDIAKMDRGIQGYCDGVFWERNTLAEQTRVKRPSLHEEQVTLFTKDEGQ